MAATSAPAYVQADLQEKLSTSMTKMARFSRTPQGSLRGSSSLRTSTVRDSLLRRVRRNLCCGTEEAERSGRLLSANACQPGNVSPGEMNAKERCPNTSATFHLSTERISGRYSFERDDCREATLGESWRIGAILVIEVLKLF